MRILRDNGLTIVLMLLFAGSILGHALAGWRVEISDALRHGQAASTLAAASATRSWMVGNSAMRLLPPATAPRVTRPPT